MHKYKSLVAIFWTCLLAVGCTDQPLVTALEVTPKVFSIKSDKFYARPFTVRARYSDGKAVNVTSKVSWVSENSALIGVNVKGELQKQGSCLQKVCIVSLVVTDPESGKSQRVEVKLYPDKQEKTPVKKETTPVKPETAVDKNQISEEEHSSSSASISEVVDSEESNISLSGDVLSSSASSGSQAVTFSENVTDKLVVRSIAFRHEQLALHSGELVIPEIVFVGEGVAGPSVELASVSCFIETSEPDVLAVEENCALRALAPGRATIALKSNVYDISRSAVLTVQVNAKTVSLNELSQSAFLMESGQQQRWFKLTSVPAGIVQRISAKGVLPPGFQVFVIPDMENSQGTCINTVPTGAQQVSCFVQPAFDHIYIMLHKPGVSSASVRIDAEQLSSDYMAYSYLNNGANPQQLVAETPFSAFILANELGLFNRHYYSYMPAVKENAKKRIVVTGFDVSPGLEVFWANGFCVGNKVKVEPGKLYCDIPADAEGEVSIIVIANNQSGGGVSPVSEKGGTFYDVLVTNQ